MPGYPLFLAGVYSLFGHDKTAVRIIQALMDTATCAMIGILAYFWEPDKRSRQSSSNAAMALAAICPFTAIYTATILTETSTIFFAVAMCLAATMALRSTSRRKALWLWIASGLIASVAVLFRPDSGIFAFAIALTLGVATLSRAGTVKLSGKRDEIGYRPGQTSYLAVFSLAFCLVLVPWAIRNYRVFHLFQPLSPAHGEMPGEFLPRGYLAWVRTWIDDGRYVGPVIFSLDALPIRLTSIPDNAFDSAEEKLRVGELLAEYNEAATVEMTPEIDAGFAQLARERISRNPLRYYFWLPLKRAGSLWFDTHSQYYPFQGNLLPLNDPNHKIHQEFWLSLFAASTLVYTLLGIAGAWFLFRTQKFDTRLWVLLAALMISLRVGFFATLERPEPRYVVEVFPFLSILGGIALVRLGRLWTNRK